MDEVLSTLHDVVADLEENGEDACAEAISRINGVIKELTKQLDDHIDAVMSAKEE